MAEKSAKLFLYSTADGSRHAEVQAAGLDVYFPPDVRGWSDVLDCRIPPYDSQSIEKNCEFATHVRKYYILVTDKQVALQTPPTAESDA